MKVMCMAAPLGIYCLNYWEQNSRWPLAAQMWQLEGSRGRVKALFHAHTKPALPGEKLSFFAVQAMQIKK